MAGAADIRGAVTTGTYRLVRPLGRQGGRVHEARHDRLAGRFAVKLFGEVEPRAFQRNAQLAAALHHPGIVEVIDYSAMQGQAFVVMEYIDGRALPSIIADSGLLPAERVGRIIESVAVGLQAAHRQGLAHGHLEPERIFVLPPGPDGERTKIVGFGLNDDVSAAPELTELTPYTAPEQLSGPSDARSDQFALAAIAYEMLTGVPPFDDSTERQEPPTIRDYAPEVNVIVDDVIRRGLSPDPDARWHDVHAFATRLREATDGGALEEKTRLAPLPLTVRPSLTPTPVDGPALPVLASVEVDLRTPPPNRWPPVLTTARLPAAAPALTNGRGRSPGASTSGIGDVVLLAPSGLPPPSRGPTGSWPIRPTPTFSFNDLPDDPSSLLPQGRRRAAGGGGSFRLVLLMVVAGLGGYFTVKYRAWQDVGPLLERATATARSLRALSPWALPDDTPPPPQAPAGTNTTPRAAAVALPSPTPMRPEVVPIEPPVPEIAPRPPTTTLPRPHHHRSPLKPLSAEAAEEEALLANPSPRH
jgi:serine/threonine protein kinase